MQRKFKARGAAGLCGLVAALAAPALGDTVLATDDGIIRDALCVGSTCGTSVSGLSTIYVDDPVPWIYFDDTSVPPFPATDWILRVNGQNSSDPSYLSIFNQTTGVTPFQIDGDAPNGTLVVDGTGRVGIGIFSPDRSLHMVAASTPGIHFEQTAPSYDWYVDADNSSFRIVSDTAQQPFLILPGAPNWRLAVGSMGVGLNTLNPQALLHAVVNGSPFAADPETAAVFQNSGKSTDRVRLSLVSGNAGSGQIQFGDTDSEFAGRIRYFHTDDRMDFVTGFGQPPALVLDSTAANVINTSTGARLTAGGVWTNASSRALKHDVAALDLDAALAALEALRPVAFRYDAQPEELTLGFIAEDVPDLVAMNGRETLSPMDIVAVLTKVVQEQDRRANEDRATIAVQSEVIAQQQAALAEVISRLERVEAGLASR